MNDEISRKAAINAICEDGTRLELQGRYSMTMAERKQRDADILDTLPAAEPKSYRMGFQSGYKAARRWIPFAECRPWEGQQILVCDEDGVMWMTVFRSCIGFSGAWLPLPEPYKEKP